LIKRAKEAEKAQSSNFTNAEDAGDEILMLVQK
jgi:hypothetical protein